MKGLIKDASKIFTGWLIICFLVLAAVDAYEYERTGACNNCLVLEDWYKSIDKRGTF